MGTDERIGPYYLFKCREPSWLRGKALYQRYTEQGDGSGPLASLYPDEAEALALKERLKWAGHKKLTELGEERS